jgi:hypothetical protein
MNGSATTTTPSRPPRERARRRAAVACASAGLIAATAYVVQRLYDHAVLGTIDPLLVLRESHTAYYWRAFVATWWGGTIGSIAWAAAGTDARIERLERAIAVAVVPWTLALAIAARVFP